jgi:ABC-type antimicrobial peptide transport system permease subunit
MIKQNTRVAFRNLIRLRSHTVISLVGLVIGLASVFAISAWTIQELQYDRFHDRAANIYMVTTDIKDNNGNISTVPETPAPLADELQEKIPDIEHSCHFIYIYGGRLFEIAGHKFMETGIAADARFFDILSFRLQEGNIASLEEPNSILLTQKLAAKLFPAKEAMGQSLLFDKNKALVVRGIIEDLPENSSLQFDYIVPYELPYGISHEWWQLSDATYIKIGPNADFDKIKSLAREVWRERITDDQFSLNLFPITKLRYGARFEFFNAEHGNSQNLFIFNCISILILLLSCLNYINLVSASFIKRKDEVIIKRVNGASTGSLMRDYLSESFLLSVLAWLLAVPFSILLTHLFQSILEVKIDIHNLFLSLVAGFFLSLLFVGFLSGLFPGLMIGSIQPSIRRHEKGHSFISQRRWRNVFIVSQFVLSISLVIGSLVIVKQTRYLRSFEVGYERENIMQIVLPRNKVQNFQALKDELMANPIIESICFAGSSPVYLPPIIMSEGWTWKGLPEGSNTSIYGISVDHDYLKVFQIPILEGRFFSPSKTDVDKAVINEKLAGLLGFSDPLGERMARGENVYEIIGVVKDFHFQHLSNNVQPLLFLYSDSGTKLFVRMIEPSNQVSDQVQAKMKKFSDQPFVYDFITDKYEELYRNESKLTRAIVVFTLLTIILSCIGLIGLISYTTETRTREIGIRKVCGASISKILVLLNMGIIKWILLGVLCSWILSWMALNRWLQGFASKITLDWWFFVLGALTILLLTSITVSLQSWKAATRNPAEALKYE